MRVPVMNIGRVRMRMDLHLVAMPVVVGAVHGWVMLVTMMIVVVPMRVFVLERFMNVPMVMGFGQMQVHAATKK